MAQEGHPLAGAGRAASTRACSISARARWTARVEIVRRIPGARVAAADFAREMLRVGRRKLRAGAAIETHAADGHRLPYRDGAFDAAFSAFCVRNFARPAARACASCAAWCGPAGASRSSSSSAPTRPRFFFDKIYNGRVLPLVGWAVTGDREAYRYLPESIERFCSRGEYAELLREVGFAQVDAHALFPSGVATLVTAS